MRRSFVQINGVLYEKGTEPREEVAPMVMGDIEPYQSMIDGSLITSRSKHREHLRQHGCQEIGNETKHHLSYYDKLPPVSPQKRKELIRSQIDAMTHREFRAAIKRDVDRVKWQSNE